MLCGCTIVKVKPSVKVIIIEPYDSIVRTIPTAIVHTIEQASDALSMEMVAKLFSAAFEYTFSSAR
jgi:hypothetical protein